MFSKFSQFTINQRFIILLALAVAVDSRYELV